jgi:hypothetical protein
MWTFAQSTGRLSHNAIPVTTGYAGHGPGKDNPQAQATPNVGPIPQGLYAIGPPYNDPHLGTCVFQLTPDPSNAMFGRSGFLIHGDNPHHPGQSSEGCIVLPEPARAQIACSGDTALTVTP